MQKTHPSQGPIGPEPIRIKQPARKAGGWRAVYHSLCHLFRYARRTKALHLVRKVNQTQGFDCPGCAWPDPEHRSSWGEFCENGAKALAEEASRRRTDPEFFARFSVDDLANKSDFWLGKQGRITHPMWLEAGSRHYRPVSWEQAFARIGQQLTSLASPDEAIFYTSGRTSNEAAFLYQLFVRMYGTNNLPDCSNMCHESSGKGLGETLGIGKGSVTLKDLHEAEVIMVMGQNPGTNHPRMLTALQTCKQNGGYLIAVNPLPEAGLIRFQHPQHIRDYLNGGTPLCDLFLQVRINGDVALLKAIMYLLWEAEKKAPGTVFDLDFIAAKTLGFEALIADLKQQDLQQLIVESGVPEDQIREAAQVLIKARRIIICWAMGLTQHRNGVDNIREIVNLLLLKGSIGKPGAGTCPVRGHSNVQGDRTMGIWEKPPPAFLDRLGARFKFSPPRHHGYDTVQAIQAMHAGNAKVFVAMGGNFLSATPDTSYTAEALRQCELTVHVSTKLNRSHLIHGHSALILPCLGRSERDEQAQGLQFVSVENSMGVVHASQGQLKPVSDQLLSEVAIVVGMASATLTKTAAVGWTAMQADYDQIRSAIEACIPGFEQYNQRVRQPGGFYLPNGARKQEFNTPSGKAHFTLNPLPADLLPQGAYRMMTIRSHDQYNTTIYGLHDRYRGIHHARRVVMMNPDDLATAGLEAEQRVDLISRYEEQERVAEHFHVVPYPIPKGCVATYFPEANVLVPVTHTAKGSNTPASKLVHIWIKPHT